MAGIDAGWGYDETTGRNGGYDEKTGQNGDGEYEPYEWWDLKMLSSGQNCQELFKRQLQQQLEAAKGMGEGGMNDGEDGGKKGAGGDDDHQFGQCLDVVMC